jgi:glucosamine--fructose-6-phosphate aminotransferase (isomerizing)
MDNTRFVREIFDQPAALRTAAGFYGSPEGRALLCEAAGMTLPKRRIIFTGMGTSFHAPYLILHELAGIPPTVEIRDAGEILHFGLAGVRGDDILIAISQSGESAETRKAVCELKGKVPVIAVVNDTASFMGRSADIVLPLHAGEEASISAKTYTNTLAVLLLLSAALRGGDIMEEAEAIRSAAELMEARMEETAARASEAADFFGGLRAFHAIARGSDLVTAEQLALIAKEGAGIFGEALSGGLFRHGPMELAGPGHGAVCFLSRGSEPELTAALARELADAGSRIIAVADSPEYACPGICSVVIGSPGSCSFPLLCAPFIELFVHETAKWNGREAGIFRHIGKVTDRE